MAKEKENSEEDVKEIKVPYGYFEQPNGKLFQFYLSEEIGPANNYIHLIHTIRTASENDTVILYLNTPGGELATGVQIINAIRSSQAKVVGVLDGVVASLGTLIFLSCLEYQVHNNGLFMAHNYSGFTFGKGNEQAAQLTATMQWYNQLATELYVPFMTKQELDLVLKGSDLWLTSAEVTKRLNNMVKIKSKK